MVSLFNLYILYYFESELEVAAAAVSVAAVDMLGWLAFINLLVYCFCHKMITYIYFYVVYTFNIIYIVFYILSYFEAKNRWTKRTGKVQINVHFPSSMSTLSINSNSMIETPISDLLFLLS